MTFPGRDYCAAGSVPELKFSLRKLAAQLDQGSGTGNSIFQAWKIISLVVAASATRCVFSTIGAAAFLPGPTCLERDQFFRPFARVYILCKLSINLVLCSVICSEKEMANTLPELTQLVVPLSRGGSIRLLPSSYMDGRHAHANVCCSNNDDGLVTVHFGWWWALVMQSCVCVTLSVRVLYGVRSLCARKATVEQCIEWFLSPNRFNSAA